MSDPYERDNISVTLKQDGKDGTWVVFHGTPTRIREQIIEFFAMSKDEADVPLFDLVSEATRLYKASGNINSSLGGRVVNTSRSEGGSKGGDALERAFNEAAAAPKVDPTVARLTAAVEGARTREALRMIYAKDEAAFVANPDLKAAWAAKGKSLPS